MPASRTISTKSTRSDDQHPYIRYPEPLGKYTGHLDPPKQQVYNDTRTETSPRIINSHSLIDPTASEKQTWSKMGTTLIMEVQSSRLMGVPHLSEDLLTEDAISNGMALAKGDNSFTTTFSDILAKIRNAPLKISKLISVNFWKGRRQDAVVPQTAGVPIIPDSDSDSNVQAVKVDEQSTASSDQDSQATQLDENASLASGSDENGTETGDDAISSSTADPKKGKGKAKPTPKKVDNKPKKPLSSEEQVCIFFNRIADTIREAFGIDTTDPKRRVFSARFKDKAPDDAPVNCIRKPDCAVLDYNVAVAERACWSNVHSLIEIKASASFTTMKDSYNELLNCARMVLAAQHNRRFVLGATLCKAKMILFVFDRSGVVGSKTIDINKEPEFLIRVVCGLIFVDDIRLGFDKTITKKDEGGYAITMNGIEFDCDEPLYIEKAVRGRGTGCFRTQHKGEDAVIKDSWVDDSRKRLEHEILDKVKDVEGIVRVIDHEIVEVEGKADSTSVVRRRVAENNAWVGHKHWKGFNMIEARTHRRILMKPYGQPLESFANLTELMLAIKDIVKIIEDLIERKVLHRDISLRNLILARADPKDPNSRIRGYLIDFDYALDLENISPDVAKGARTGTLPFMAIEMLVDQTNNRVPHAYYHDLESVFYSLCWLCTAQQGPYSTPRCDAFDFSKAEVSKWNGVGLGNPTFDDIRRFKTATVCLDVEFSIQVLDQFAPYFEPLKPVVAALREVMVNYSSNMRDLSPFFLKKLEKSKAALEKARENGEPVDPSLLSGIPTSERNHRDVFNSIYHIIDSFLIDLVEPALPKECIKPPQDAQVHVKKLSREQLNIIEPMGVRELVDGNAEAKLFRMEADEEAIKERAENGGTDAPISGADFLPHLNGFERNRHLSEASAKLRAQFAAAHLQASSSAAGSSSETAVASSSNLMPAADIKPYGGSTVKPAGSMGPPPPPNHLKNEASRETTHVTSIDQSTKLTGGSVYPVYSGSLVQPLGQPLSDHASGSERSRTPTPADHSDMGNWSMASANTPPTNATCSDSDESSRTPTHSSHCLPVVDMEIPLDQAAYLSGHKTPPRHGMLTRSRTKRSTKTRDETEATPEYGSPAKRQKLW